MMGPGSVMQLTAGQVQGDFARLHAWGKGIQALRVVIGDGAAVPGSGR